MLWGILWGGWFIMGVILLNLKHSKTLAGAAGSLVNCVGRCERFLVCVFLWGGLLHSFWVLTEVSSALWVSCAAPNIPAVCEHTVGHR
ncbi:MAG: hypothetical protein RL497_1541 [Pseudomonadota bacterium]|jgi:hypothetical protein